MPSASGCLDTKPTSISRATASSSENHHLKHTASSTLIFPPATTVSVPDPSYGCVLMEQYLLADGLSHAYEDFSPNRTPVNLCAQVEQLQWLKMALPRYSYNLQGGGLRTPSTFMFEKTHSSLRPYSLAVPRACCLSQTDFLLPFFSLTCYKPFLAGLPLFLFFRAIPSTTSHFH
jgi:hypothetical protein